MNEYKDIYIIVSKNIKKYRKLRNYTQEELANKCSMTREYIGRIESDKGIKYFSLYTIYIISIALDIPIICLFLPDKIYNI